MDLIARKYNDLAATCNGKCTRELEIRFYVKRDKWETYKDRYSKDVPAVNEKSINAFNGRSRIEAFIINGQKVQEKYIEKLPVHEVRGADYKIAICTETTIPPMKLSETKFIRLKNRLSYIIGKWRYDFTTVETIDSSKYSTLGNLLAQFKVGDCETPSRTYEFEVEYIGDNIESSDIKYILDQFISADTNTLHTINNLLGQLQAKTIKELTNNPRPITVKKYYDEIIPDISNYYVSDKADGSRALVYCDGAIAHIITDKGSHTVACNIVECVLDAEYVGNKVYVFDVLHFKGADITMQPLSTRIEKLAHIDITAFGEVKPIVRLDGDYKSKLREILIKKRPYDIDGLIFTSSGPYNNVVYKWKPPQHNTCDFLVRRLPEEEYGKYPYEKKEGSELYVLYIMVRPNDFKIYNLHQLPFYKKLFQYVGDYFPTHFMPSINDSVYLFRYNGELGDIEGKVVEMIYEPANKEPASCWKAIRIRHDRRDPNYIKVAETCFTSYYNPFNEEKLYENPSYFKQKKTEKHRALTKYNRFVVHSVLNLVRNSNLVVDLASGQGADLYIYYSQKVSNLVMSDRDTDALEEIVQRKYNITNPKFNKLSAKSGHRMSLQLRVVNLMDDAEKNLKILEKFRGAKAVIINFAIHYVLISKEMLDNLYNLVDGLLDHGGMFIFTCFNGEDILTLPDKWDVTVDGEIKYSIHRIGETLDYNTRIKVYQPFSGSYYEEPIVDLRKVIKQFTSNKYTLEQSTSFNVYKDDYEQHYGPILDEDIHYAGLYYFTILRKHVAPIVRGARAGTRVGVSKKK